MIDAGASTTLAQGRLTSAKADRTLFQGSTLVDTETVTVNGNGQYTTPTGFSPTAAGNYYWDATYGGDPNKNGVTAPTEQVTVQPTVTITTGGTTNQTGVGQSARAAGLGSMDRSYETQTF